MAPLVEHDVDAPSAQPSGFTRHTMRSIKTQFTIIVRHLQLRRVDVR